jgi:hypothetical protein
MNDIPLKPSRELKARRKVYLVMDGDTWRPESHARPSEILNNHEKERYNHLTNQTF